MKYDITEEEKEEIDEMLDEILEGNEEIDEEVDLEDEDFKNLWSFAQKVSKKLQKTFPDKRIAVAVVGLEVPHAHIHLIPITNVEEMNFKNTRLKFSDDEYQHILASIINS